MVTKWDGLTHHILHRIGRQNSLGIFYGMLTQFLGFKFNSDEYKVMGLSSFGSPNHELVESFQKIIRYDNAGGIEFNREFDRRSDKSEIYTTDFSTRFEPLYSSKWELLFGAPRRYADSIENRHIQIAASAQFVFEEILSKFVAYWLLKTGERNLCLSGGCVHNVKAIAALRKAIDVDSIFIPPVAGDSGLSLGAALLRQAELGHRPTRLADACLGPSFEHTEVQEQLSSWGLRIEQLGDPISFATECLENRKIVGWFQGRMEFGPRALGNRSILANPTDEQVREKINAVIKRRERFRPFAPSVLFEKRHDFFPEATRSPFMTEIFTATSEATRIMPAAIHVDGTARVQTVERENNGVLHELLTQFYDATGVPALLNTSFNVGNEPIVCSPADAVRTFFSSPLDELVIGEFRVIK